MTIKELMFNLKSELEKGVHENTEVRVVWDDDMNGAEITVISANTDEYSEFFIGIYVP